MHFPWKKNTSLKAAAICSNNRNNIVAEYEVYIVAEYGICLLKKVTPPFKAQLLSMLEGNTMSLKDNAALRSKKNSCTVESTGSTFS
jgi:hypothetical protein